MYQSQARRSEYEQLPPQAINQQQHISQHEAEQHEYTRPACPPPAQQLPQAEVQAAAQSQSIYRQEDDGRTDFQQPALVHRPTTSDHSFGVEGYSYKYSNCTGKKKALLIGINYLGTKNMLKGCINDVNNVKQFLIKNGYNEGDIVVLTDDQTMMAKVPMRANIIRALEWLVKGAEANDSLFFHYSGHGSQLVDEDGDEEDGYDETIVPLDFETNGQITDDELHYRLVAPLKAGVRLTALFDSCHSGSVLDLPYTYSTKGVLKEPNLAKEAGEGLLSAAMSYMKGDNTTMLKGLQNLATMVTNGGQKNTDAYEKTKRTKTAPADVVMFSGSKDNQTSADATEGGIPTGALSFSFIKVLSNAPQQSYLTLLQNMREAMSAKYTQKPQFSSSHPIDVNLQFIF